MYNAVANKEMDITHRVADGLLRHPQQINKLFEADAEIIQLPGSEHDYLVLKTDGIHEEIKERIYVDPWLIGWMAITAPVSDIAAVGATPTGVLLSLIIPSDCPNEWLTNFKAGVNDACSTYGVYVLGGDTNFDNHFSVSATVAATIKSQPPVLRKGLRAGDHIYVSAPLGAGNAFGCSRLFLPQAMNFRPIARLKESKLISSYASACIDTSDGFFPALAVLAAVNCNGFELETSPQNLLAEEAIKMAGHAGLPDWTMLAGPMGEYELMFGIPPQVHESFLKACDAENWAPIRAGIVIQEELVNFKSVNMHVQCHPAEIPNLFFEAHGDVPAYFNLLMQQHKKWSTEKTSYDTKKPQPSDHSPEYT